MTPREMAETFIAVLTGNPDSPITWQTFVDTGESSAPPCTFHAPLHEAWDRLMDMQEHAHGVFLMVNEGDGLGRSAANVVALRALFYDADGEPFPDAPHLPLRPAILVSSGNGEHGYWPLVAGEDLAAFTPAQEAISRRLHTDPSVKDRPRVLRLPGTYNLKDRARPRLVELVWANAGERYTVRQVLDRLGAHAVPQAPRPAPVPVAPGRLVLGSEARQRAEAYAATIDAIEGQGGDRATYRVAAKLLQGFGLDRATAWDVFRAWNSAHASPPWDEFDLGKKFANAERYCFNRGPVGEMIADACAGIEPDGSGIVPEAAGENPQLDPERWCVELGSGKWRFWDGASWGDGVPERSVDRLLENEGDLGTRKIKAWKKRVAVVVRAEPVYSSHDRIAVVAGKKIANLYRWPTLTPAHGEWGPVRAVLSNLVAGNQAHLDYVLAYLASTVQRAHAGTPRKKGVSCDFYGPKGAGKGVAETLIQAMLGAHNVASISQGDLDSAHNAFFVGKLFVVADELIVTDGRASSQSARMKRLITGTTRMVNPKGKDQYQTEAVENFWLFSNDTRIAVIERQDRRHSVFQTGGPIPVELGAAVADDARAGGPMVRALLAYLLDMPAPERIAPDYRPLITEAKAEAERASGSSAARFAAEVAGRGFYSVTGAWAGEGIGHTVRDLYLTAPEGFRALTTRDGATCSPVITRRRLMEVYRAFSQEIGAPALRETALLSALGDECPGMREAEMFVDGRREPVLVGLPGMMPQTMAGATAPAEAEAPAQGSLILGGMP